MDSDSKMDLDDAVAGHPVAMYELQELRAQRDAAHNDARLLDGQIAEMRGALETLIGVLDQAISCPAHIACGVHSRLKKNCLVHGRLAIQQAQALLPAPGVAPSYSPTPTSYTQPDAGATLATGVAQEPDGNIMPLVEEIVAIGEKAVEPFEEWHRRECPTTKMGNPSDPVETCADVEARDGPPGLVGQPWARAGLSFFGTDPDPDDMVPAKFKGKSCLEVYAQEHPPEGNGDPGPDTLPTRTRPGCNRSGAVIGCMIVVCYRKTIGCTVKHPHPEDDMDPPEGKPSEREEYDPTWCGYTGCTGYPDCKFMRECQGDKARSLKPSPSPEPSLSAAKGTEEWACIIDNMKDRNAAVERGDTHAAGIWETTILAHIAVILSGDTISPSPEPEESEAFCLRGHHVPAPTRTLCPVCINEDNIRAQREGG